MIGFYLRIVEPIVYFAPSRGYGPRSEVLPGGLNAFVRGAHEVLFVLLVWPVQVLFPSSFHAATLRKCTLAGSERSDSGSIG